MDLHQERKIKFLSYLRKLLENHEIAGTQSTSRSKIKLNIRLRSNFRNNFAQISKTSFYKELFIDIYLWFR